MRNDKTNKTAQCYDKMLKKEPFLDWQSITDPILTEYQIELWVRYAPAPNPDISGNKLLKLKYQLEQSLQLNSKGLLTFGGAFSNHLIATAAAAAQYNLKSIGIVRGSEVDLANPSLALCQQYGMHLIRVSREQYQRRHDAEYVQQLSADYAGYFLIPEGGSCEAATLGISELDMKQTPAGPATLIVSAVGSGGTIAGLVRGAADTQVLGLK